MVIRLLSDLQNGSIIPKHVYHNISILISHDSIFLSFVLVEEPVDKRNIFSRLYTDHETTLHSQQTLFHYQMDLA